ncbi:EcoAI/FtnUII family type I restriction enzme subunit R [Streptomyces goshikiensis]|uniref:EcoAI/FtnUII family type I restriction enzme subunit R n=1 Tax=Streptomyces goshikiensis TaxID=1942 RepID=UPI002E10E3BC|nr:DEAD/DEAH box helicase family protein [Streptomyces goshikiensis]WSR97224.1 DEAD/DEAH box helicase family protein [Streptomyces goshikiensis]
MTDLEKVQLTETEIRTRYITPALSSAGWPLDSFREEFYYFSAGRIQVTGNAGRRKKAKRIDYLLEYRPNMPIAVVEAKDNQHEVGDGMQQAIEYAEHLDVPSVFTSNGDSFVWHDRSGLRPEKEVEIGLDEFPSPETLYTIYKKWKGIDDDAIEPLLTSQFYDDGSGRRPRYYQRVAVNRVMERIAAKDKRLLLVMATGTGKTYTAAQIIWRFMETFKKINPTKGQARVLFLADRNILIDQTMMNDFTMFNGRMAKLSGNRGTITNLAGTGSVEEGIAPDREINKSFELYLSLYQAVTGNERTPDVYRQFSPDFFDLIIIDECHRGSTREDSVWRAILEYFSSAIQLGMTATPKETKEVSNIDYFGDPVYTYSLRQGIDDGFLAPYKVVRVELDVDRDGFTPTPGQKDDRGQVIPERLYTRDDFDDDLVLPQRTQQVAKRINDYLQDTNPLDKTIVFCRNIFHANRMRRDLVNLNPVEMAKDSRYVMQITGDEAIGKMELDNFIDPESTYPVIATTSKLLSTGVDAQTVKVIVLDSKVESMTEFKQMIGRGSRVREDYGKWFFVILDFRNVTKLFEDKAFDGDPVKVIEVGEDTDMDDISHQLDDVDEADEDEDEDDISFPNPNTPRRRRLTVSGQAVTIVGETVELVGADGKAITTNLAQYTHDRMIARYPTIVEFLTAWVDSPTKTAILDQLGDAGVPIEDLVEQRGSALDPFDVALQVAYDQPGTYDSRADRAARPEVASYLEKYTGKQRQVIAGLLAKYVQAGIRSIEEIGVLKVTPLSLVGSAMEIIKLFGSRETYLLVLNGLISELYREGTP